MTSIVVFNHVRLSQTKSKVEPTSFSRLSIYSFFNYFASWRFKKKTFRYNKNGLSLRLKAYFPENRKMMEYNFVCRIPRIPIISDSKIEARDCNEKTYFYTNIIFQSVRNSQRKKKPRIVTIKAFLILGSFESSMFIRFCESSRVVEVEECKRI